jgi:hypothetical protein
MPKEPQKGYEYLKKAAAAGEVEGFMYAAFNYINGEAGCPKDPATAYVYYILANHFATHTETYFFGSDREEVHIWYVKKYSMEFENISDSLSPEMLELAEKTAADWVVSYNALVTRALEEARKRRAPILEEFRKELAPVAAWLAEQDAAETSKPRQ